MGCDIMRQNDEQINSMQIIKSVKIMIVATYCDRHYFYNRPPSINLYNLNKISKLVQNFY